MGQGNFSTRSWVCLWGLFAGDWRIFGVEVEKGVFNDRVRLVRRFCGSSGHTGSFRPRFPPFLRATGNPPRGSRGRGKGNRRSWEVERIDPGRIPPALNRSSDRALILIGMIGPWCYRGLNIIGSGCWSSATWNPPLKTPQESRPIGRPVLPEESRKREKMLGIAFLGKKQGFRFSSNPLF